jgi:hypothetical protein
LYATAVKMLLLFLINSNFSMNKYFYFVVFFTLNILVANAQTIFTFGAANPTTTNTISYKGGGTNYDGNPNWRLLTFNETTEGWLQNRQLAIGFGTNPPARNTAIPEDASAGGGGVSGARYPTIYFRKMVNLNPANYQSFKLKLRFDDGIVLYVNGVEKYRNNLPAGAITYNTLAANATNSGADVVETFIDKNDFVNGNNIIAVEVHQNAAASSDLFLDIEMAGTPLTDQTIFAFGQNIATTTNTFSYIGGGTNYDGAAAPTWKDANFNEVANNWVQNAKAALGFGVNPPARNTAIPEDNTLAGGGIANARYPTLYFRKTFTLPNPDVFSGFKLKTKFDDGVVIYINGNEYYRGNMPVGNIFYSTLASSAITNSGADVYEQIIPVSAFNANGNNVIAVEVHQANASSSDLFLDMELVGLSAPVITKGPFLQMGSTNSIIVKWTTSTATNSRVAIGATQASLTTNFDDATPTTEHSIVVNGLTPDTKYFYSVGSTSTVSQSGTNNYFVTLPTVRRKVRIAGLGDCGNASANQIDTKNALLSYLGTNTLDALYTMGDNAYYYGTEAEFQSGFFDIYKDDILKNCKLYPTPGNHDYGNSGANTGVRNNAYYNNFVLPTAGELGGVASGTEAYYSYNVGDVHMISLDSYGQENGNTTKLYDTLGAQTLWLKNDLASNTKPWVVVYFHHPPYTMTSHNSDNESWDLGRIREELLRILERYGVDLVVCGHSHGYERSYLLKNYYKANAAATPLYEADFNAAIHTATNNTQNALYDGTTNSCAYSYDIGKYNHGSVYVVSGSAGQVGGTQGTYPHNAMFYSNASNGGSFYFEADSTRLDAKFISYTGSGATVTPLVRDQFTIFKGINKNKSISVGRNAPLTLTAPWNGSYYWPNNAGATTKSVNVNTSTAGTTTYIVKDGNSYSCIADTFVVTVVNILATNLQSFTVAKVGNTAQINFALANATSNQQIRLQHSTNGANFSNINNFVTVAGQASYAYTHTNPAQGNNYYRLVQITNGKTEVLATKTLSFATSNVKLTAVKLQNNTINVFVNAPNAQQGTFVLYDAVGKQISVVTKQLTAGDNTINLNSANGLSIIKYTNSFGITETVKVVQ